ncbi:NAD(P)/FAD-dependent oxidoreductase [Saccharopolyspora hattusasensis]|uniref:NAD(P)/FAD-dependent oxidoreductase n=1 Tax=Saccharopolyspora hattusasensis TaxID=1128679 RepID=UPI003D97F9FC
MTITSVPEHITVLGAGILGAAAAHHLSRRGARVTVVDAQAPGYRSTTASFACVNGSAKIEPALAALNDRGVAEYHDISAALGDAAVRFTGQHFVATDPDSLRVAEQRVNAARARGYGGELVSGAAFREREPRLRLDTAALAVAWFHADGWADPDAIRRHFLTGLQVQRRRATSITPTTSGRVRIDFDDGDSVDTDRVVNATGTGVADIRIPAARAARGSASSGFVVSVDTPVDLVSTVIRTPRLGIRPDGPNRALLHSHDADHMITRGEATTHAAADILVDRARRMFPDTGDIEIRRIAVGPRPTPPDGAPSVGARADVARYYELSAHSGVTLAPLLGRLLAKEILTGTTDPLLAPFRPDRFREAL